MDWHEPLENRNQSEIIRNSLGAQIIVTEIMRVAHSKKIVWINQSITHLYDPNFPLSLDIYVDSTEKWLAVSLVAWNYNINRNKTEKKNKKIIFLKSTGFDMPFR